MGVKTFEVLKYNTTEHYAWYVWCPACDEPHSFDSRWTFDGNHEAPTFQPSMLVHENPPHDDWSGTPRCHSYLRRGVWEFLADSTHAMKGQNVPAPDWADTRYGKPTVLPSDMPEETSEQAEPTTAVETPAAKAAASPPSKLSIQDTPPETDLQMAEDTKKAMAERKEAEDKVRAAGATVMKVLQHEGGLGKAAAALLASHLFLVECGADEEAFSHLGGAEVESYAKGFARQYPVISGFVSQADSQGFYDALQRAKLKSASAHDYLEVSAILRNG